MLGNKILLFGAAWGLSSILTAVICRLAPRVGLVDKPDTHRKLHTSSTPLGGGVAVYLATSLVLAALLIVATPLSQTIAAHAADIRWLLLAGAVIVLVGLVDDRLGLRGRAKLGGQVVAVAVLMAGGLVVHKVAFFGWQMELGLLSIPFTMFWLLGAINALNLLDGIDGMATTIGFILVSAIAVLAWLTGNLYVQIVAIAFAGSLLGFLRFNFPPARIFLGDAGSMLIGLIVGALAIKASLKGPGTVLIAAPLAVWAIPAFDSLAAILRRKLTGRSVYSTDRGHLHHRLLGQLGSNTRVLACVGAACAVTAGAALFSVFVQNDLFALVTCLVVVAVFVVSDLFGRAELSLLANHLGHLGRSMLHPLVRRSSAAASAVRLQGNRPWELLWQTLTDAGQQLSLAKIHLDVNIPSLHEGYSASWNSSKRVDVDELWSIEIPLTFIGQPAGRLTVWGLRTNRFPNEEVSQLMSIIKQFELQLSGFASQSASPVIQTPVDEAQADLRWAKS